LICRWSCLCSLSVRRSPLLWSTQRQT
jgi:hypothetical protein